MAIAATDMWAQTLATAQATAEAAIMDAASRGVGTAQVDLHNQRVAARVRQALVAQGFAVTLFSNTTVLYITWWAR
jgi:hypothetical protein